MCNCDCLCLLNVFAICSEFSLKEIYCTFAFCFTLNESVISFHAFFSLLERVMGFYPFPALSQSVNDYPLTFCSYAWNLILSGISYIYWWKMCCLYNYMSGRVMSKPCDCLWLLNMIVIAICNAFYLCEWHMSLE